MASAIGTAGFELCIFAGIFLQIANLYADRRNLVFEGLHFIASFVDLANRPAIFINGFGAATSLVTSSRVGKERVGANFLTDSTAVATNKRPSPR